MDRCVNELVYSLTDAPHTSMSCLSVRTDFYDGIKMSTPSLSETTSSTVWNVPNQITLARLILAVVMFVLIPYQFYWPALILFIVAAGTDWLDGYWARKFNQVTQFGRVLDPFVDKFIICGAFVYLVAEPQSGIAAWMAVIVIAREMLVTAIRGFLEQHGADFSAQMAGKLKMVFQCVTVVLCLLSLEYAGPRCPGWLINSRTIFIWLAIFSTVYSGIGYLFRTARLIRN